jgi:hypothetical protein
LINPSFRVKEELFGTTGNTTGVLYTVVWHYTTFTIRISYAFGIVCKYKLKVTITVRHGTVHEGICNVHNYSDWVCIRRWESLVDELSL